MDEVSVYRNSINEMKEMEKGDEELGVSLRKRLSFYTKEWIHSLSILRVSRVWSILIRSLLPRLTALCVCVCVCVLAEKWWFVKFAEYIDFATRNLFAL